MYLRIALFLLPCSSIAREIVFPPSVAIQGTNQKLLAIPDFPDEANLAEFQKYAGLTTFANLPWVHCLSSDEDVAKYDIALLGAPFDSQ